MSAPAPGPSVGPWPTACPRTTAAGIAAALPLTRSAAAASSSADGARRDRERPAVGVDAAAQVVDDRDAGGAQREVGLPEPPRPARGVAEHHAEPGRARSARAAAPAGAGLGVGVGGQQQHVVATPVLDASTPAAAMTGPADRLARSGSAGRRAARSATTRTVWLATAAPCGRVRRTGQGTWRRPCSRRRGRRPRRAPRPRAASAVEQQRGQVVAGAAPRATPVTGTIARPARSGALGCGAARAPGRGRRRRCRRRRPCRSSAGAGRAPSPRGSRTDGVVLGRDEPAVEEVLVEPGHGRRRWTPPRSRARQASAWPRTGIPPMSGETPTTGAALPRNASRTPGTPRMMPIDTTGLLGGSSTTSALPDRVEDAGRGASRGPCRRPDEPLRRDRGLVAHPPLLEVDGPLPAARPRRRRGSRRGSRSSAAG